MFSSWLNIFLLFLGFTHPFTQEAATLCQVCEKLFFLDFLSYYVRIHYKYRRITLGALTFAKRWTSTGEQSKTCFGRRLAHIPVGTFRFTISRLYSQSLHFKTFFSREKGQISGAEHRLNSMGADKQNSTNSEAWHWQLTAVHKRFSQCISIYSSNILQSKSYTLIAIFSSYNSLSMKMHSALFVVFFLYATTTASGSDDDKDGKEMKAIRDMMGALSRQIMLQQMFVEERIRSDGDSGVKQVRSQASGTKIYHQPGHSNGNRLVSIHEHANNIRTVGLGEFIAVLNGVEFRTRHNDYRLNMANRTGFGYHTTEPIPYPDVPPEVTSKGTVDEQIQEMREWFKAWSDQDHKVRDYRQYFKPVLCYLEGAWTSSTKEIDEPFESDRHFIDAATWFELQEKVRFTSYTGRKDNLENFSFLPTTIIDIINGTIPVFAQWNYRILCHPIQGRDLPLNRLRVINDLHPRMASRKAMWEHGKSRAARFQLNPFDQDTWREGPAKWGLLDKLMYQVPGKDNYPGKLKDDAFDLVAHHLDPNFNGELNAARYHRWFKVMEKGAMGLSTRHRGFADDNLFVAMTTQPKIAGMSLKSCKKNNPKKCRQVHQKFSYAIPLEIIYLTPLYKWNPFDIQYKGDIKTAAGRTVTANGRNGGRTKDTAYDGTNSKIYYMTPSAFFTGGEVSTDAADTTQNTVGVLDKTGTVRITRASGTRVFLPTIAGVGTLRQRYPIMPVHGHGSSVWKELEATKEILMKSSSFGYMCLQPLGGSGPIPTAPPNKPLRLMTQVAASNMTGPHRHEVDLTPEDVEAAMLGKRITKETGTAAGHEHRLQFRYIKNGKQWKVERCGDKRCKATCCGDLHGRFLNVIS